MSFPDYIAWMCGVPETHLTEDFESNLKLRHRLFNSPHPVAERLKKYIKIDGQKEFFVCPHCDGFSPVRIDNLESWWQCDGDRDRWLISHTKIVNMKKHLSSLKHRENDWNQFEEKKKMPMFETFELNEEYLKIVPKENKLISVRCHLCRWVKKEVPKATLYNHCHSQKHFVRLKEKQFSEDLDVEINWDDTVPIRFNPEQIENPFIDFFDGKYRCSCCHFGGKKVSQLTEDELDDLRFVKRFKYSKRKGEITEALEKVPRHWMEKIQVNKHLNSVEHKSKEIN